MSRTHWPWWALTALSAGRYRAIAHDVATRHPRSGRHGNSWDHYDRLADERHAQAHIQHDNTKDQP